MILGLVPNPDEIVGAVPEIRIAAVGAYATEYVVRQRTVDRPKSAALLVVAEKLHAPPVPRVINPDEYPIEQTNPPDVYTSRNVVVVDGPMPNRLTPPV